jgi:hypothetical protein
MEHSPERERARVDALKQPAPPPMPSAGRMHAPKRRTYAEAQLARHDAHPTLCAQRARLPAIGRRSAGKRLALPHGRPLKNDERKPCTHTAPYFAAHTSVSVPTASRRSSSPMWP